MIEISAAWWKKNKPKTLGDEPLTAALSVYDKAETERRKQAIQPNYEKAREALHHAVAPAVAATLKKCNKTLHKETIANLTEMAKAVEKELKIIENHYATMRVMRVNIEKLLGVVATSYGKFQTSKSHSDFQAYQANLTKLETAVEHMCNGFDFYSPYQGQLHQKVHGLGTTVASVDSKFDVLFDPAADPKLAAKTQLILAELDKGCENMSKWVRSMA